MTFDKIKKMIAEKLNAEESKITMETTFIDDLGADSLDAIELVMDVEDEFGISFTDEETQTLQTVGDLVKLIDSKK